VKIEKLKLKNFRNYDDIEIVFNDKLNIIIGNNAQGKTNILEAIYFLSITKSNFPINDKTCIKKDMLFSKIEGLINNNESNKKISILMNANGKKLEVNGEEIKKHSQYLGNLRVILFNPDDVRLIKESPNNRRRFLNIEISQLYLKYINVLNDYNLILRQRNEYLKVIRNGNINNVYLDILNSKMVELATDIYNYRINFVNEVNKYIGDIYNDIAGVEGLYIKYLPSIDVKNDDYSSIMLKKLESNLEKEKIYGTTLIGPHRDDFSFILKDNDLLLYGSQGQQKMAILALKLAEIEVFYNITQEYPVLLLDDLFSELDVEKRNKVIGYLNKDIQIIVTTTDLKNVDKRTIRGSKIYEIDDGRIVD
jgi:DNA replication and repair protein RecF